MIHKNNSLKSSSLSNPTLPYYFESGNECTLFRHAFEANLPFLIKGPTGCGKTRFVEYMACELKRPLVTVSCNEDTTVSDLLGRHLFVGGETVWVDGPVTRAVRQGAILYLDEFVEARSDTLVAIHALSDHRRTLFLDRTGEELCAQPGFMLVVTYNPGYQRSLKEIKPSTRQRFIAHSLSYPEEENEIEIVSHESKLERAVAIRLVKMANKIRRLDKLNLLELPSTRLLIAAGKLISRGLSPRQACKSAVSQSLTDEPECIEALDQLIDLSL